MTNRPWNIAFTVAILALASLLALSLLGYIGPAGGEQGRPGPAGQQGPPDSAGQQGPAPSPQGPPRQRSDLYAPERHTAWGSLLSSPLGVTTRQSAGMISFLIGDLDHTDFVMYDYVRGQFP